MQFAQCISPNGRQGLLLRRLFGSLAWRELVVDVDELQRVAG